MRLSPGGWPLHVDEEILYQPSLECYEALNQDDMNYVLQQGGILVPAGFTTDLASVPRLFWRVFPPFGTYSLAAIVHDYLYSEISTYDIERSTADRIFRDAMITLGVGRITRNILYNAVRHGGWIPWSRQRGK